MATELVLQDCDRLLFSLLERIINSFKFGCFCRIFNLLYLLEVFEMEFIREIFITNIIRIEIIQFPTRDCYRFLRNINLM